MSITRSNFAHWVFSNSNKQKLACVDSCGGELTYQQLENKTKNFAHCLKEKYKILPQQRVGIFLNDTVDWPVAFLSCIMIGANPLLLYRNLLETDLNYLCDLADCRFIICKDNESFAGRTAIPESEINTDADNTVEPYVWNNDEMCWWTLSSGSTGKHKIIVNSHGSFERLYNVANKRVDIKENDVVLSVAKMSFAWGLAQLMWTLSNKSTICLIKSAPAPAIIFNMIHENKVTTLCIGPYVLDAMCKRKDRKLPSNLKIMSSGEYLTEQLRKKIKEIFGLKVFDGYGTSEIWSAISIQQDDVSFDNMGSVIGGIEYKIINERGKECLHGEPGELHVSHPAQALMYWKDQEASNENYIGRWVKTGDIVIEKEGKLIFKGRKDDVFKIKGIFVSPLDIEKTILEHRYVENCVVALEENSSVENLVAYVKFTEKHNDNIAQLRKFLKTKITTERIPKHIIEVFELPRTVNNKIKRKYFLESSRLKNKNKV